MKTCIALALLCLGSWAHADAPVPDPHLGAIATAHGTASWAKVKRVKFTWRHEGSGTERSYDWDVAKGTVAVTAAGKTLTVPASGEGLDGDALAAHKGFINDSYWLLFEVFIQRDAVTVSDLGEVTVPGFEEKRHATAVTYPAAGGYTPGDRYVLYSQKGEVTAWAFHPGGAKEAKLVTSREGRQRVGGLLVPTRFDMAGGKPFIIISGVEISE